MNNNKRYAGIAIGILIVLVVSGFWFVSARSKQRDTSPQENSSSVLKNEDIILVGRNFGRNDSKNGIYEINVLTKELKPHSNPVDAISTFAGLPKEIKNKQISVVMSKTLVSQDKTKAIVVFTTLDETKEPSAFDGSLPIIKADEFVCDIAIKKCSATDILALAYNTTRGTKKWSEHPYGPLYWSQWDSVKNLLYGHLTGEGVGNSAPVYVFNLTDKLLRQTTGYDALNEKEKRAEVPNGAFSPSLSKFVMVDESPNGTPSDIWDLLLYDSADLSKPSKKFDISLIIDKSGFNRVSAVAWSADEKMLVLETNKQIFTLDLESGKISLKYTDESKDESGLWLDFNAVDLSQSGRYIVFVDYDKSTTPLFHVAVNPTKNEIYRIPGIDGSTKLIGTPKALDAFGLVPSRSKPVETAVSPGDYSEFVTKMDEHITIHSTLRDVNFCGKIYKVQQVLIDGLDVVQRVAEMVKNQASSQNLKLKEFADSVCKTVPPDPRSELEMTVIPFTVDASNTWTSTTEKTGTYGIFAQTSANKLQTVLKAIDLKDNNKVTELLREEDLNLYY